MIKRVLLCAVPHKDPCDCPWCYPYNRSVDLANKDVFANLTQSQKQDLLITDLKPWFSLVDRLKDFEQVDHVQLYQLFQYGRQYSSKRHQSSLDFVISDINLQYDIQINYQTQKKLKLHTLADGSQGSRLQIYSEKKDTLFVVYFKTVHIERPSPR